MKYGYISSKDITLTKNIFFLKTKNENPTKKKEKRRKKFLLNIM